jgi:D-alanine-D-alanine ligase
LRNLKNELSKLPFPVFIKPNRNGSSICSYVLKDLSSLDSILNDFYAHHKDEDEILIQEYIEKKVEISCGCLEKKDHIFIQLPPIEIVPKGSEFFDYKAKYTKNASLERIPAIGISKEQREIISKLTIDIHKLLGCRLYSRSDYLVADEKIYYLETNTLPGMTNTSLIPQESKAIGINYKDLISFYIENT